jgi:hypothetical protein
VFCQRLRKELEQQTTAVCAEWAATAKHPVRRFVFNGEEEWPFFVTILYGRMFFLIFILETLRLAGACGN